MYFANSAADAVSKCQADGYVNCKAISKINTSWTKKEYKCIPKTYAYDTGTSQTVSSDCSGEVTNPTCNASNVGKTQVTCAKSKWIPTISTCTSTYAYGTSQTATTTILKSNGSCYNRISTDICFNSTTNNLLKGMACKTNSPSCSSSSDVGNEKIRLSILLFENA